MPNECGRIVNNVISQLVDLRSMKANEQRKRQMDLGEVLRITFQHYNKTSLKQTKLISLLAINRPDTRSGW